MTGTEARGKPWLDRADWAARRCAGSEAGRTGTVVMFSFLLAFFVVIAGLFALMVFVLTRELGIEHGSAWAVLTGVVVVAVALHTLVTRVRSHGTPWSKVQFSCDLETLPGVIGGWFKAQVEAALPAAPRSVSVQLTLLTGEDPEGGATGIWGVVYELASQDVVALVDGRFRIPVRFHVPQRLAEFDDNPRWGLAVTAKLSDGHSYTSSFSVPIYATSLAPAEEQQSEKAFPVREHRAAWPMRVLGPRRL